MSGHTACRQLRSTARTRGAVRLIGLAAMALSLLVMSEPAAAQDKRVTIHNDTRHALVAFYSRPAGKAWTQNVLRNRSIRPGSALTVNFGSGRGGCRYDVRVVFSNKAEQVNQGIDVCKVGSMRYQ